MASPPAPHWYSSWVKNGTSTSRERDASRSGYARSAQPSRPAQPAADALRPAIASLLRDPSTDVKLAALRTAAAVDLRDIDRFALLSDTSQSGPVRVEALKLMVSQKHPKQAEALELAARDANEALRIEATRRQ